ncbi:MAG TPA: hypothetical protein VK335_31490 [Bryobacteraceae bacterium]|nr:hypothetical protein [Bryobacteraceae bacterium]
MIRRFALFVAASTLISSGLARQIQSICGSNSQLRKQELFLHRQAVRAHRRALQFAEVRNAATLAPAQDIGEVAILPDDGGVVARRNAFDLDQQTLTFVPAPPLSGAYGFQVTAASYDDAAAAAGTLLPLADDDTRQVSIAFPFPFFGNTYKTVFVNSDGNLTFTEGDNGATERSLGRLAGGAPRIAPLFEDLDPSQSKQGVFVTSEPGRLVVSWVQVPEYSVFGTGGVETFQVRLYPDGRIQFAYAGINTFGTVVGIGPGRLLGESSVVSFTAGDSAAYAATVAERFITADEIDIETATQRFFETHDDSYDYIAFFNDEGIWASTGALAWEQTLRNHRTGYGDVQVDDGAEYGSASRLQSVLNMGPLSLYPASPTGIISLRAGSGYNMLKLLGHEAGHLFLAYASVPDPNDPAAQPMLGIEYVHWAFNFDAEGSFMEGNQIQDNGVNAEPRFVTTAAVDQYSPLDQYLMGLRAPGEVPPTFLVTGNASGIATQFPQVGVGFDGMRQDIQISDIIQAEGRRTPDSSVAQRHFRMAFVLIVKGGTTPPASEVAQVDGYRSQFEPFYSSATGGRAFMDATLRHALSLSVAPAAGVVAGGTGTASLTIQQPATSPVIINIETGSGAIAAPPSVVIPAGATTVTFPIQGLATGVDDLTASIGDGAFETAYARVQVLPASALTLSTVSGDWQTMYANGTLPQPILVRVSDQNNLSYPGAQLQALPTGGGTVTPRSAVADSSGQALFQWTPAVAGARLQISLIGSAQHVTISALPPTSFTATGVVNSASSLPAIAPGELMTINGTSLSGGMISQAGMPWPTQLAGVSVLFKTEPAQLLSVSNSQINLIVPLDLAPGAVSLTVQSGGGTSASLNLTVTPVAPGIFADSTTNFGNVMNAGTSATTAQQPAPHGGVIEIYCTGLGAVHANSAGQMITVAQPQVSIAGVQATVESSGLAPAYGGGMYQVNVQVPQNVPSGIQNLVLTIDGVSSNSVKVAIQ